MAKFLLRDTFASVRASPLFAVFLLVTLTLVGLIGLMVTLMALRLGFLLPGPFSEMGHFTEAEHRVHDLTYGLVFVPGVVGLMAQLRRPSRAATGMVMALIPWVALLLAAVLSNAPFVFLSPQSSLPALLTLFTALLHPSGRDFFRSFSARRVNRIMLGLAVIAAVPLLAFAVTNIGLQTTLVDEHAGQGHFGFMAAFSFTAIGLAILASLRSDGWRVAAWVAGLVPIAFGLTSLVYADVTSSVGLGWAVASTLWGASFIASAELTKGSESPGVLGLGTAQ